MEKPKSYILPDDNPCMVNDPIAVRVPVSANVASLRHDLMDAIYATDNRQMLYSCLVFLNNQKLQESNAHKDKLLVRLADFERLENGWDGEGSIKIKKECLDFSQRILMLVTSEILEHWVVFPDGRGYVYWDYTNGNDIAGITISPDKVVGFMKKNGHLRKYDPMDLDDIVKMLEEVHG